MLSKNKTIISMFCIICAGWVSTSFAAKSVFIISGHNYSVAEAFRIDSNHVEFQGMGSLLQGLGGALGIDVWPTKELMFATYENSGVISWTSTTTLQNVGEYDTGISGYHLAGIVIDQDKEKLFVAKRQSNQLYIYSYDDVNNALISDGSHALSNLSLPDSNGMYGLALDEANNLLYITDKTKTVRVYDTNNFSFVRDVNIRVDTNDRAATGITVDPVRGCLYTCNYNDDNPLTNHNYLVKTQTSSPYTSTEVKIKIGSLDGRGIGVDCDLESGLVYCTAMNYNSSPPPSDFRVYDSNLVLQDTETNANISGPAGVAVGGSCELNQHVRNITKDINFPTIQSAINDANDNDVLQAWPGTYPENVYFGSKLLTLQSTSPEDPCIVAQTVIAGSSNPVTFTDNNSVINGFTIANSSGNGVSCSGSYSPTIKNCVIRNNGDGVYCAGSSAPTIVNCIIKNNSSGIYCSSAKQVKIMNNWIVNNGSYGVYIFNTNNEVTVRNNTISNNASGGIFRFGGAEPNVSNCIIWNNGTSPNYNNFSGTPACTKVNYCCINNGSTGYSGQHNITTDPCFVDDVNVGDYHIRAVSLCRNTGDPNTTLDINETDIDGQPRRNGTGRVDIGADEFYNSTNLNGDSLGQIDFHDYAIFANAWKTHAGVPKWNALCDFIDDNDINCLDLAWLVQDWYFPPPTEPQAPAPGQEPPPPIYLAYDGNMTPDPNTEVTVYVYSDIPLSGMDMFVTVTGDANITTAMSTIDCNQYGWDSEWSWDPYIDPNGWVEFGGISLAGQATGTVGYFKFIYNSGQVTVSITADSYAYDANSQPATFSTDPLIFGGESMQSSQQQSMMQQTEPGASATGFSEEQSMGSPPVDVNDLADQLEKIWLEDAELRATITQAQWQQFIDSVMSSQ